jgi:lysyl-tRNA synthetase class 2
MQINWRPTATVATLRLRAALITKIRGFFSGRGLLEVDTPLLGHASVTDLHLHSFQTVYQTDNHLPKTTLYLQTSPEFAMKRLLAAGSGPIFQICKAFRNSGESGRLHNPEFTLLEWYRPGFNHHQLMDEMNDLLQTLLATQPAERLSYADVFAKYLNINPHQCTLSDLKNTAEQQSITEIPHFDSTNKDNWLFLLMSHIIEPQLGQTAPVFIFDFPVSQAALAKIRNDQPPVAERFEVYYKGIELANGFHELTDAQEQRKRFLNDLALRQHVNYPAIPIDEFLLAALSHGLPDCAGVALGIDRLIMLAAGQDNIADIVSFTLDRA